MILRSGYYQYHDTGPQFVWGAIFKGASAEIIVEFQKVGGLAWEWAVKIYVFEELGAISE
jgi:hypothetical protein